MPIAREVHNALFEGKSVQRCLIDLLARESKDELADYGRWRARLDRTRPRRLSRPAEAASSTRVLDSRPVGAWRSLVAHQSGGLVVVGSNPAAPTIFPRGLMFSSLARRVWTPRRAVAVPVAGAWVDRAAKAAEARGRHRTRDLGPTPITTGRHVRFLVTSAWGIGGTVRATITAAAHLASNHDVEVVSVVRSAAKPAMAIPDGLRLRALFDKTASGVRVHATWQGCCCTKRRHGYGTSETRISSARHCGPTSCC